MHMERMHKTIQSNSIAIKKQYFSIIGAELIKHIKKISYYTLSVGGLFNIMYVDV